MAKSPVVLASRADRLGDLILTLPSLALLKRAGFAVWLHTSIYARSVAEWAKFNNLCDGIFAGPIKEFPYIDLAIAFHHCPEAATAFRALKPAKSIGPRSKLSSLWTYTKTIPQHRSRVEKSEMEYNCDLALAGINWFKLPEPDFEGLPALKVPPSWVSQEVSPDVVINISNLGSAENLKPEKYLEMALGYKKQGLKVHILCSKKEEAKTNIFSKDFHLVFDFPLVENLIAYLAKSKLVVSSSTGPLHIAHAAGINVLGLFPKKTDESLVRSFDRWRPAGYWHTGSVEYIEMDTKDSVL